MSEFKQRDDNENKEKDIVFSKAIKAGKRIYYIDVKRSRNEDYYIAITESKKRVSGFDNSQVISFEKHKIFLYKEDFRKFMSGLQEVLGFVDEKNRQQTDSANDFSEDASDK
ncbi:MAG: hypothetical protein H6Q17_2786 [Bacteroidetes bacterium]|nr:hypothetical protein [Bacteroidota bacterium]